MANCLEGGSCPGSKIIAHSSALATDTIIKTIPSASHSVSSPNGSNLSQNGLDPKGKGTQSL